MALAAAAQDIYWTDTANKFQRRLFAENFSFDKNWRRPEFQVRWKPENDIEQPELK
jgi:hypothetical protein